MMISDEERREVAARLRELAGGYVTTGELESALGICLSSPEVDLERDERDLHRMAELIEPTCDRDALLELVKELELGAQCFVGRKWTNTECERMAKHLADDYEMIASRIRKALGVTDA